MFAAREVPTSFTLNAHDNTIALRNKRQHGLIFAFRTAQPIWAHPPVKKNSIYKQIYCDIWQSIGNNG